VCEQPGTWVTNQAGEHVNLPHFSAAEHVDGGDRVSIHPAHLLSRQLLAHVVFDPHGFAALYTSLAFHGGAPLRHEMRFVLEPLSASRTISRLAANIKPSIKSRSVAGNQRSDYTVLAVGRVAEILCLVRQNLDYLIGIGFMKRFECGAKISQ
jgi:hypothetical protein